MSSAEIALMRLCASQGGPTAEERAIQRGIDATMRAVIADAIERPNSMNPNHAKEITPFEARGIAERASRLDANASRIIRR